MDPTSIGDAYIVRVDYEIRSLIPTNNRAKLYVDIGGTQGEIQKRLISLPTDQWVDDSKTILIYTLGTFKSNGGTFGIEATNQAVEIGNYSITICRVHDASI